MDRQIHWVIFLVCTGRHLDLIREESTADQTRVTEQIMTSSCSHVVPGEHVYDGIMYAGVFPARILERIKSFEFRDDDIILATYPKSGKLWPLLRSYWVMTSEHGNTLHISDPFRWDRFPSQRASRGGLWYIFVARIICLKNSRIAGDVRHHDSHLMLF